ncbi:Rieske 2Fe-2S domain-containing protein [Streptomyces prunicolor]|uniref:Rieske 2Fe-2S domain-containing protein n=1 Tax=Streptomyces prunicolor TaxID=67348 RepID=UPI00341E75B3
MESNHDLVPGRLECLRGRPIPAEGDGGVFSEGWYPVCLSSAIPEGGAHGVAFLDGRVVVTRGDDGDVRVVSAYCVHLGADLPVGQRTAGGVRCAFHGWDCDGKTGRCTGIASGDPVPPRAQLFAFPAAEMYGVVFAHNGAKPLYDLPAFEYPESDLYVRTWVFDDPFTVDPWVISANAPDLLHLTELHNFDFIGKPFDEVVWPRPASGTPPTSPSLAHPPCWTPQHDHKT